MNHFQKEDYPRKTIYDTINRMQLGGTINDKKKIGCPTSWTPSRINEYINECLEKHLLSFTRDNHPDSNYIFWIVLAGCHYSKQTITWMDGNVKFVPID